jgi:hypothetical protein
MTLTESGFSHIPGALTDAVVITYIQEVSSLLCQHADAFVIKFPTSVCYIEGNVLQLNIDSLQPAFYRCVYLLSGRRDVYNMFRSIRAMYTSFYKTVMVPAAIELYGPRRRLYPLGSRKILISVPCCPAQLLHLDAAESVLLGNVYLQGKPRHNTRAVPATILPYEAPGWPHPRTLFVHGDERTERYLGFGDGRWSTRPDCGPTTVSHGDAILLMANRYHGGPGTTEDTHRIVLFQALRPSTTTDSDTDTHWYEHNVYDMLYGSMHDRTLEAKLDLAHRGD